MHVCRSVQPISKVGSSPQAKPCWLAADRFSFVFLPHHSHIKNQVQSVARAWGFEVEVEEVSRQRSKKTCHFISLQSTGWFQENFEINLHGAKKFEGLFRSLGRNSWTSRGSYHVAYKTGYVLTCILYIPFTSDFLMTYVGYLPYFLQKCTSLIIHTKLLEGSLVFFFSCRRSRGFSSYTHLIAISSS